jgi:hypothetical protein
MCVVTLVAPAASSHAQTNSVAPKRSSDTKLPATPAAAPVRPAVNTDAPRIQLAILLDNSGSMTGLIEQAKSELWRVVNELTTAKQHGKQPRLQVALYTYGNPPPKRLCALTDDLDKVSEALFAVRINGGSEYCGQVIQTATKELDWSKRRNDLKLIFIAGNEPFTQGPVDYRQACKEAIAKGITVNTIHCGPGIPAGWRDGAILADGKCMAINHNTRAIHVDAPQDKQIARLGVELNKTYVTYGSRGGMGLARQTAQDVNANNQSASSSVQRSVSKANDYYRNSGWDLVDAVNDGTVELAKVEEKDLPENMQKMSVKEREKYIKDQAAKRKAIQKQINDLNAERQRIVDAQRKKMAKKSGKKTLDQALTEAIRSQASAKNFKFKDKPKKEEAKNKKKATTEKEKKAEEKPKPNKNKK